MWIAQEAAHLRYGHNLLKVFHLIWTPGMLSAMMSPVLPSPTQYLMQLLLYSFV